MLSCTSVELCPIGFDWDGQYGGGIDVGCGNDWALHL